MKLSHRYGISFTLTGPIESICPFTYLIWPHTDDLTYVQKLQGISKGLVAEKVLSKLIGDGESPDFVLCIGDDRSDEDMFESISNKVTCSLLSSSTEVFACTVGQKPSKARYYLESTKHVLTLLECLATNSSVKSKYTSESRVSFESSP